MKVREVELAVYCPNFIPGMVVSIVLLLPPSILGRALFCSLWSLLHLIPCLHKESFCQDP